MLRCGQAQQVLSNLLDVFELLDVSRESQTDLPEPTWTNTAINKVSVSFSIQSFLIMIHRYILSLIENDRALKKKKVRNVLR